MEGDSKFCPACGTSVNSPPVVVVNDSLAVFIPKNMYALWAYYLGIFSLLGWIPVIGIFFWFLLGLPAIICGIKGIKYAKQHPEARGVVHAWVGIGIGAVGMLITVVTLIILVIALVNR